MVKREAHQCWQAAAQAQNDLQSMCGFHLQQLDKSEFVDVLCNTALTVVIDQRLKLGHCISGNLVLRYLQISWSRPKCSCTVGMEPWSWITCTTSSECTVEVCFSFVWPFRTPTIPPYRLILDWTVLLPLRKHRSNYQDMWEGCTPSRTHTVRPGIYQATLSLRAAFMATSSRRRQFHFNVSLSRCLCLCLCLLGPAAEKNPNAVFVANVERMRVKYSGLCYQAAVIEDDTPSRINIYPWKKRL